MASIISLNNLITMYRDWAGSKAPLINDFGYGDTSDIGTSNQMEFPYMWVTLQPSSMTILNNNITPTFNFVALFLDQINDQPNTQDENGFKSNNVEHIMSDTAQLAADFVNDLLVTFGKAGVKISEGVTLEPILDETPDKVCGWRLDFAIQLKSYNCSIPSFTPASPCKPVVFKNSNGTYEMTLQAGTTFTSDDIVITLGDGTHTYPSNINIDLSQYNIIPNPSPGTYVPGTFQLPWNSNSANVTIATDGEVEKTANDGSWNDGADFIIEKTGNFTLNFNMTNTVGQTFAVCGIDFFKGGDTNYQYNGIDMAFMRDDTTLYIYEDSGFPYTHPDPVDDTTQYTIQRQSNFVFYKVDGVTVRTASLINTGKMFFTNSLFSVGTKIENISIVY